MTNQQQNQPKSKPVAEAARKGQKDSHAAGSGSSTGDPGNARGQSRDTRAQDIPATPPDDGAVPID